MTFDVFIFTTGIALVEFVGTVEADTQTEALDCARLMYDREEGEEFQIQEAQG